MVARPTIVGRLAIDNATLIQAVYLVYDSTRTEIRVASLDH